MNENIEAIFSAVYTATKVSASVLMSDCKIKDAVDARFICSWELHLLGLTNKQIAETLQRSRASIYNSLNRYADYISVDPLFRSKAEKVKELLNRE